jgi:hypothetical protein
MRTDSLTKRAMPKIEQMSRLSYAFAAALLLAAGNSMAQSVSVAPHDGLYPYAAGSGTTEFAATWRYPYALENDQQLNLNYTARATFDTMFPAGPYTRMDSEYLVSVDMERSIGRFTPHSEIGLQYTRHAPHEANAGLAAFGALGASYRHSDRSTSEMYFEFHSSSAGEAARRELSLNFTQRTSTRTRMVLYAVKNL